MTERQRRVWNILQHCQGVEQAVTSKALARLIGLGEREIRAVIAELRRDGYPIASRTRRPFGYFIPESPGEARECEAQLRSRIQEIEVTANAFRRACEEWSSPA